MSITTSDNSDTTTNISPDATANAQAPAQMPKRSSRRANTAERRATHNAVERARRETLNGRFLDLAAMLPNLANVRRPSKSAIVNSSIALIQSQRRNRIIAAREVRLMKAENDALRQELNDWRQRANMPRVEEPVRSSDLLALINLNEEEEAADNRAEFDGNYNLDDGEDYAEEGDEELQLSPETYAPYPVSVNIPVTHNQQHHQHQQQQQQQQQQHAHLQQQQQAQAHAQAALFAQQKAAMIRASQALAASRITVQPQQQHLMYGTDALFGTPPESFTLPTVADNAHLFGASWAQPPQKQHTAPPQLITTPPSASHGLSTNRTTSPYASTANQAFLGYSAQGLGMFHQGPISDDDNLSVGSGSSHHDASSSHSRLSSGGATTPDLMMGTSPVDHSYGFTTQGRRPSLNIPTNPYLQSVSTSPNQPLFPLMI